MPELKTVAKPKVPSNKLSAYSELLKQVRRTLAQGRERAADAVEREKVRTCWETGKLIHKHILLNQNRAEYGTQVLKHLSSDLGISETELGYMVQFARAYPISRPAGKLSWSHYEVLLSVNDPKKREELAHESVQKKWDRNALRREIQKRRAAKQITLNEFPASAPLEAKKGMLYTYKIVLAKLGPWQGKPVIDLGFSNYLTIPKKYKNKFKEGDIIQIAYMSLRARQSSVVGEAISVLKNATDSDLFTYKVYVDEVTDGDTIWVLIDLGLGVFTKQQLRLRGLDCPEIATRDGQAAKKFVERSLRVSRYSSFVIARTRQYFVAGTKQSRPRSEIASPLSGVRNDSGMPEVIITSTKSDKYDRYLADVWIGDMYLNQKLIDKGLAVKVSE